MKQFKCPSCGEELPSITLKQDWRYNLIGLGFALLVLPTMWWWMEGTKFSSSSGLVVDSQYERREGGDVVVLGKIRNSGSTTWRSYEVEAEFFDKENQFVDKCHEHLYQPINPGGEVNFKIDCSSCERRQVPDYARYSVAVVDANSQF